MRSNEPDQIYSSKKVAKEVSICIENKWTRWVNKFENWGVVKSIETADGYSVSGIKYGTDLKLVTINYLADIENISSGSETKLYQYLSLNLGKNPFFEAVDECQ